MTRGEDGRGVQLERCYRLAAMLAQGIPLDRNTVVTTLGIGAANADRHIKTIQKTMQVTTSVGKDGLTSVRAARAGSSKQLSNATVVAACFGASLARLFHETAFEKRLRDVVAHVLEGVRDQPKFRDHDRQFLFILGGGERALRRNGAATLETIVDAILEKVVLRIKHTRFEGARETIYMKPLSLALHEHQLYVLGFVNGGLRNVRFSRITGAMKLTERFEYPTLDDYDPRLVFRDSLGIFIHDDDRKGIRVRDVQLRLSHRWSSYVETHRCVSDGSTPRSRG
jgi:predicted DNA-binding transcriptional regulator YafY